MLVIFESTVCLQRLRSLEYLREMLRPPYYIWAYRCGKWSRLSTSALLPGDLVSLEAPTTRVTAAQAAEIMVRAYPPPPLHPLHPLYPL